MQRSSFKTRLSTAMASAFLLFIFSSFTSVLAAPAAAPIPNNNNYNYGGYLFSLNGSQPVGVSADWNVPQVSCKQDGKPISGTVAVWPGLGGVGDNKLEQTGTASRCINGTPHYFAWWEVVDRRLGNAKRNLPRPISHTIAPNDHMKGAVVDEGNGKFILSLIDLTQPKPWTFTQEWDDSSARAVPQTGEFIAEDEGGGTFPEFKQQITFTNCYWFATNQEHSLASAQGLTRETIVSLIFFIPLPKENTQDIQPNGTSFSITWKRF